MTFTLDAQVAAVLAAAIEHNGPPPAPPVGDVASRRVALDAMLEYFNNEAQPVADKIDISDHSVRHARRGHAARAVVPPAVERERGGGAVPARRRDDRRLGTDLRRAGLPVRGPYRRLDAVPGVPARTRTPASPPVEDAYAGLAWLAGHAAELGIDPGRIAVMGDSAGGGLAAGVAILSRDRKGPAVARQLLIYPMLDDRTTTPDPYIAPFAGWSYDDNATGWNALLGTGHEHREVDPPAAPGRLRTRRGLPPAYIEVGQLDIFRDEDLRYALTLSQAGVPVELHLHPGVPHEYDAIAFDADVSRRAQSDRDRVLRSL